MMTGGVVETLCVTGRTFSPQVAATLWTHGMARQHSSNVWVPAEIIDRLGLKLSGTNPPAPVGVDAANGRRFFYNASQLECSQEELVAMTKSLLEARRGIAEAINGDTHPLNTNGEPFPLEFAQQARLRTKTYEAAVQSRFWATEYEAAYIFRSPFKPSFLTPENAVTVRGGAVYPRLCYYNVCGTRDPSIFSHETCRRYRPVNYYGQPYPAATSVQMKALSIQYGCMNDTLWVSTRRAERVGVKLRSGVKPLLFCVEDMTSLVNVAMTEDPDRLKRDILSFTQHGAVSGVAPAFTPKSFSLLVS
ncbi:hypothetical protein DPX39_050045600 [Trypanosoma brucei equiperdum]|uniref:Trypanosoma Tc-38 (p38) protein domain-containing protein n=1 Tax=Trypanosoma brucei equiperdum TaxID=630700 RepID=A0A3L6LA73_9TRYP|nr:hypothetical protein DPX39_050045600 [Trypanosoma brucei equiperdum]